MNQGSAKIWLSEDVQAFFEWVNAVTKIREKSPLETAAALAQLNGLNPKMLAGPEGERKAVFGDGRQDYMMQRYKNLALINISGSLVKNDNPWNKWYGLVSYDEIRRSTLLALQDSAVDGILLTMNTPGGSAAGADSMAGFFSKANNTKPLYAYAESDMCSGGYYLGAPAREIYAQRAASIGSIGVVMVHYDYLKMYQEAGITPTVFRAGEFKALGSQMEHLDKKATADIQARLDDYFKMFNEHVVEHRPFDSVDQMRATAGEGRVFMAEEAKEVGLVDQVAELEDTLEEVSAKAGKSSGKKTQFAYSLRGNDMPRAQAQAAAASGKELSAEQLAALASGASPAESANAGPAAAASGVEGEDDPQAQASAESGAEGDDVEKPEVSAASDAPQEPAAAPAAGAQAVDLDKLIQLSNQVGTLTAQLETAKGEAAKAVADLQASEQLIAQLQGVVNIAINNRQVALGFQPSDVSSLNPQQGLELFNKLDADFKQRYQPGAKSAATQAPVTAPGVAVAPAAKAARGMTGKL